MPLDFESCLKESDDCTVFFQTLLTRRLIQAELSNDTSFAELLEKHQLHNFPIIPSSFKLTYVSFATITWSIRSMSRSFPA